MSLSYEFVNGRGLMSIAWFDQPKQAITNETTNQIYKRVMMCSFVVRLTGLVGCIHISAHRRSVCRIDRGDPQAKLFMANMIDIFFEEWTYLTHDLAAPSIEWRFFFHERNNGQIMGFVWYRCEKGVDWFVIRYIDKIDVDQSKLYIYLHNARMHSCCFEYEKTTCEVFAMSNP